MTEDQILSELNKIVELSSSMLDVARKGDWEQVQTLEQQRKHAFDQTFPLNTESINDVATVAMLVQKISDLDKDTMRLIADGSKELSGLINKISTGRQAVSAYRDVAER